MNKPTLDTRIRRVNREISKLTTNRYFDKLPLCDIGLILAENCFRVDDLDGIYCGPAGSTTHFMGENVWLNISWYQMPSGRFEVVAYASKGARS